MNKRASVPSTPAQSLTELAYAHLEELIVTLELAPGGGERDGALGAARHPAQPICEALQRLARERLLVILPRSGIIVPEIR